MTCARGSRGGSPKYEGDRPSGAFLSFSLLGLEGPPEGPPEEDLGMSLGLPAGGELARLAPLTVEVDIQRQVGGIGTHGGVASRRSSTSESGEVATIEGGFDLTYNLSRVTQRQLSTLCT